MKRLLLVMALLGLVLPITAWANGIDITNQFGTITILNSGITSRGSQLITFGSITAAPNHALGSVAFSTGVLSSGSIWTGGTFSSAGSSFVVIGDAKGVPHGTIFTGSFVGPISWTVVTQHNQFIEYLLSGRVQGMLYNGRFISGITRQTLFTYTNQRKIDNEGLIHSGSLVVPEPSTLAMLGTGLVMMAKAFRRRFLRS